MRAIEQPPPLDEVSLLDAEHVGREPLALEVVVPETGLARELGAAVRLRRRTRRVAGLGLSGLLHGSVSCHQRKRVLSPARRPRGGAPRSGRRARPVIASVPRCGRGRALERERTVEPIAIAAPAR